MSDGAVTRDGLLYDGGKRAADAEWVAAINRFWCHCGCDQSVVHRLSGGIHTAPGCDSCAPLLKLLARGHDARRDMTANEETEMLAQKSHRHELLGFALTEDERQAVEEREALWKALGYPEKLFEIAAALTGAERRGWRKAMRKIADLLAEFEDNPETALRVVTEYVDSVDSPQRSTEQWP